MAIGRDVLELQKKISYQFSDVSYLDVALTHSSFTNEMRTKGIKAESNERLEFLGDAVLELVISEYLFSNYGKYREGALTKLRQQLVCEKTLAGIAAEINLGDYVNLGNGEEGADCRIRPKILADALEALIGAVYLDSSSRGTDDYKQVIINLFYAELNRSHAPVTDYKTRLQQLTEQEGSSVLEYRVIGEDGPEHNKVFTVVCLVNNNEVGRGQAGNKKAAEMLAAKMALELFGVLIQ